MSKLLTAAEMAEMDRRTSEEFGLPTMVLMENAGAAVEALLWREFPHLMELRVLVLAGPGNNGGDGMVVARRLQQRGVRVSVLLLGHLLLLKGDAALHAGACVKMGGTVVEINDATALNRESRRLAQADVVVDAVFGTGLSRPVSGVIARLFDRLSALAKPTVAVDLPSGISSDSGKVLGSALRAQWTVALGAEKVGHRMWPGAGYCGRIEVANIGVPRHLIHQQSHRVERNIPESIAVPLRPADGHKGTFGHLLILAGSVGKTGAAVLTAQGALRAGAGLVTVAMPAPAQAQAAAQLTEAMSLPLPADEQGRLHEDALVTLSSLPFRPTALAIGPGLGVSAATWPVIRGLLLQLDLPAVLDADALNALAAQDHGWEQVQRTAPVLITPHPGEAARLLRAPVGELQEDRLVTAQRVATERRVWMALKGAGTVIADPDGRLWINETGNSGLAAGGSGDLLTGLVGGLLAQGWSPTSALRAAVWIHGAAGDDAAADIGMAGLLASDLSPYLNRRRNQLV
ncbi:MAG: NAD(P)H-hydrate dehydratase [Magnetococcus sp. WYHC-3]